jgi:hypothetical protein
LLCITVGAPVAGGLVAIGREAFLSQQSAHVSTFAGICFIFLTKKMKKKMKQEDKTKTEDDDGHYSN